MEFSLRRYPLSVNSRAAPAVPPMLIAAKETFQARIHSWIALNQRAIVSEFVELLSIPNVTSDRTNIDRNAVLLRCMLARRGFCAELLRTQGNPLVWGERKVDGADTTVLVYCHYDGQPVDPNTWAQPDPFVPVLRSGRVDLGAFEIGDPKAQSRYDDDWRLYARSAATSKAPIVAFLAALDALGALGLEPSVNLRVVMDGEEELSSPSLDAALETHRAKMSADLMLVFAGPMHFTNQPTIVFGARGIQTAQLTVYGPKNGAHSGHYGNWLPNPALRLAHLLASMKDDRGNVLVSGFYDGVKPLTEEENRLVAAVPGEDKRVLETFGIAAPECEGRSLQMALQRPALNVRGLRSAFIGPDAVTIIPDRAVAELDIRLVKETSGPRMLELLREHIRRQGYYVVDADPDDATRAVHSRIAKLISARRMSSPGFRTSAMLPESQRVTQALERNLGETPVRIRSLGGTVPVSRFIEALGIPAMVIPIVNFDNNQHAPDENVRLGNLFRGVVIYAAILQI